MREHMLPITAVVGVAIAVATVGHMLNSAEASRMTRPLCFQTEGPELDGYTPAHLNEKDVVGQMVHRIAPTIRCRGFVDGRFVEFDADQAWIARAPHGQPRAPE